MTMLNKKHSEKTKKLMSEKSKGNKAFLGRKHTEETKKKMSQPRPKRQGRPAWNKGKGKFKTPQDRQRNRLLLKYGLNSETYSEILKKQNYVCAICLKQETTLHSNGQIKLLSIDHDHITGKVRGLLCQKCNFAIGHLNDDPYLCQRAAQYLLNN